MVMKTIEEKAEAYDAAIERAREWSETKNGYYTPKELCEEIFPELAESEDEKIRKTIIDFLKNIEEENESYLIFDNTTTTDMIAWLEKQGSEPNWCHHKVDLSNCSEEYKKAYYDGWNNCNQQHSQCKSEGNDVVKCLVPKFKVGDWVVWDNKISCHIDNIYQGKESLMYTITDTNNMIRSYSVKSFDNNARLWTIQDAKDGDVLAEDSCIFIIQKYGDNTTEAKTYYTLYDDGDFDDGTILYFDIDSTKPATKEQRDMLFQKMHETDYTFDFEKKELKKLKFRVGDEVITENEESLTITRIDEEGYWSNDLFICDFDSECVWDLVEQKPTEWKQENREELTEFENAMMHIGDSFFGENAGLDPNDTATIKEQAELLLELAPKTEWSEEDERMLNLIIQDYEAASKSFCGHKGKLYWLKSFKKE